MIAFSLKKYEEAEDLYMSAYNILENILDVMGEVSVKVSCNFYTFYLKLG